MNNNLLITIINISQNHIIKFYSSLLFNHISNFYTNIN